MQAFTQLTGKAAPLPLVNIDTDMIIPKQFLKTTKRTGLGSCLFYDMRFDDAGAERPDFVLNQTPYRDAQILIALANFGCGSSREHAPWALLDFGVRVVIAPSFADIFFNNCFKNGLLPIVLEQEQVDHLMRLAARPDARMTVDLQTQTLTAPDGVVFPFSVDPHRRHCLLNGLDDIGLTEQKMQVISAFEAARKNEQPWV